MKLYQPVTMLNYYHSGVLCLSTSVNLCLASFMQAPLVQWWWWISGLTHVQTQALTTKPPSVYTIDKLTTSCSGTGVVCYNGNHICQPSKNAQSRLITPGSRPVHMHKACILYHTTFEMQSVQRTALL